jgi:hypothetical protein
MASRDHDPSAGSSVLKSGQSAEPFDAIGVEIPKPKFSGRARSLPARKDEGYRRGKRKVTLWEQEDGSSFVIELATGKEVARVRLSKEAMEALVELYDARSGEGWRRVYRMVVNVAADDLAKAEAAIAKSEGK